MLPRTLEHFNGALEFWNLDGKADGYFSDMPPHLTRIDRLDSIDHLRLMTHLPKHVSVGAITLHCLWKPSKKPRTLLLPTIEHLELGSIDYWEFEEAGLDWLQELTKVFPNAKTLAFQEYEREPFARLIHFPSSLTKLRGSVFPVVSEGDTPEMIRSFPTSNSSKLITPAI